MKKTTLFLLALFGACLSSNADVKLPSVIGSNMVLQREMPVPIWGWADPGESVTVSFGEETKSVEADGKGKWMVKLSPLKAKEKPRKMTVKGKNEITLDNILVGEVWICSGQSNMEWSIRQSMNAKEEIAASNHPVIRLFNVPGHKVHPKPQERLAIPTEWKICSPETSANFSAVGYSFGRRLLKELDVPVGLIGSNWGGTRIEPWTTLAGFRTQSDLSKVADQVEAYTDKTKVGGGSPSAIYNQMVNPLTPFAMRGAIWYQGESNGGEHMSYYHKKHALVKGWRKAFQNPKLGFYWVQLANFRKANVRVVKDAKKQFSNPAGGDGWAKIREAQTKALDIPHTGMAVAIDLADAHNPNDIHPRNKQDVGGRLAQWALHQTYGKKELAPTGPLYKSHKIKGKEVHLSFDHVGKGLMVGKKTKLEPTAEVKGGKLENFAIAGEDKKWVWADAVIKGDSVIVSSKEVAKPAAVRYGFTMNPGNANLYNKDGIAASPFRTDDW